MAINTGFSLVDNLETMRWGKDTFSVFFSNSGSGGSWTPAEIADFEQALRTWMAVADIKFNIATSASGADFVERKVVSTYYDSDSNPDTNSSDTLGLHSHYNADGDGVTNGQLDGTYNVSDGWNGGSLNQGGRAFSVIAHEIGHALGLGHHAVDDTMASLMAESARNGGSSTRGGFNFGSVGTPMAFDIAAIQAMYGANENFNHGNSTYYLPTADDSGTFFSCIWDTGGTDTIVHNGSGNATIDLRTADLSRSDAGGFISKVDGVMGGFTIAADVTNALADREGETGVIIENATGGSGDDHLFGNAVSNILRGGAGNDEMNPFGGADTMYGGAGNDVYCIDSANDRAIDEGGANGGIDKIYTDLNVFNMGNVAKIRFIEELQFTGTGSFKAWGNDLDNVIVGRLSKDIIYGGEGNDYLVGDRGADILDGGSGNDTLDGGTGIDTMTGGSGDDTYVVDHAGDTVNEYASYWTDYGLVIINGGTDTVETRLANYTLSNAVENLRFVGSNTHYGNGNDLVNTMTGGTGIDFLYGANGNDTLYGGAGNDTLDGGEDDDRLFGQGNADILAGAAGNDWLVGGAGNDTLHGGSGNDTMFGGADQDVFVFSGAVSELGVDTVTGGDGLTDKSTDTLDFGGLLGSVSVDLTAGVFDATNSSDFLRPGSVNVRSGPITGIEVVRGTGNSDVLKGGAGNDKLHGGAGSDTIEGGAGVDELTGGGNADMFAFADGWLADYVMDFEKGQDLLDMRRVTGLTSFGQLVTKSEVRNGVDVTLVSFQQNGAASHIVLVGVNGVSAQDFLFAGDADPRDAILGTAGGDVLTGNGFDNVIRGYSGDDTLVGGAGGDFLDGGEGFDTASYASSTEGVYLALDQGPSYIGLDSMGDALFSIERIVGSRFDDVLGGGWERMELHGGGGNDTLIGGRTYDVLDGGAGNDTIRGTTGQTTMHGGDGDDVMTGSLDNLNSMYGGAGNDTMTGGNLGEAMYGAEGNDTIRGGGGNDSISGDTGVNLLYGEAGDDSISATGSGSLLDGGADNDYLYAGNGSFEFVGGSGNDTLEAAGYGGNIFSGGAGADVFTYRLGAGGNLTYTVTDFEDGVDKIRLWDYAHFGTAPLESLTIAQTDAGTVISLDGQHSMTLYGISASQITSADFIV